MSAKNTSKTASDAPKPKRTVKKLNIDDAEEDFLNESERAAEAEKILQDCEKPTAIAALFAYNCPNRKLALDFVMSFQSGDHVKAALSPVMQYLESQIDFRLVKATQAMSIVEHCHKEAIEVKARSVRSKFVPVTPFNIGVLLANHPYLKSSGFDKDRLNFKVGENIFDVNMGHDEEKYVEAVQLIRRFEGLQTHVSYEILPWNDHYMQVCLFACTLFDVTCDNGTITMERRPTADFHPGFDEHDLAMAKRMLKLVENIAENVNGVVYKNYTDNNSCNILYAVLCQWSAIIPDYADFKSSVLVPFLTKWNADYYHKKLQKVSEITVPSEADRMREIIRVGQKGKNLDDDQVRKIKSMLDTDARWKPTAGHSKNTAAYNFYEIPTMPLPNNRTGVLDFTRAVATMAKDIKKPWDALLIMGHGANYSADAFDTYNAQTNGSLYMPGPRNANIPKILLKSGAQYTVNNGQYLEWETKFKWDTLIERLRNIAKTVVGAARPRLLIHVREFQQTQDGAQNLLDLIAAIDTVHFDIDFIVEYTMPEYSLISRIYTQCKAKKIISRVIPSFKYDNDKMIMLFSESFTFADMKESAKIAPLIGDRFMMASYFIYSWYRKVSIFASGLTDLWPRATLEDEIPHLSKLDMESLCVAYTVKERSKTNITKKAVGLAAQAGVELAAEMVQDVVEARRFIPVTKETSAPPPPNQSAPAPQTPNERAAKKAEEMDVEEEFGTLETQRLLLAEYQAAKNLEEQLLARERAEETRTSHESPTVEMSNVAPKRKQGDF